MNLFSQEKEFRNDMIAYGASYTGDNLNNLQGGIRTGSCYLGMVNINLGFNTEKARLWKGGIFFINIANTHGGTPSNTLIGDFQVASNIQAGEHTYFQEFWYKQIAGKIEATAGLQNVNNEFVNSEYAGLFLNSSFGTPPTLSTNTTAPIFPLTTLGVTLKWYLSPKSTWLAALYDGCPVSFNQNPYNLNWNFGSDDGLFIISEYQYSSYILNNRKGTFKAGIYTHYRSSFTNADTSFTSKNVLGLYGIADQEIWHKSGSNTNISVFAQIGLSPGKYSLNNYYFGFGINCKGLVSKNGDDILGLAVAHAGMRGNIREETAIEMTYKLPVNKNIFIQPDFQYIINPGGVGKQIRNSFETTVRLGINF